MKQNILYMAFVAVMIGSCGTGSSKSDESYKQPANDVAMSDLKKVEKKPDLNANVDAIAGATAVADTSRVPAQDIDPAALQSGGPVIDWDKKIIKTANITLELKDYAGYNSGIHSKLKSYGAYIAQEQQNETDDRIANQITIKVPVDKFDDLMNSLSGDGIKVLEKNISTEDVTGEVVDTKARIDAKKQVRAKYLELLKQAKNMDEILQVQQEINSIQEDIESASGRVDYLTHSAAYSTINLKYFQYLNGLTSKDVEPGFLAQVADAFKTGASVIMNLVIFFISVWPLIVGILILVIYFKRWKGKKITALDS